MSTISGGQTLARILGAIEGFFVSYGEWPSVVRLTPGYIEHLRNEVLSPETFSKLTEKVTFIPEASATVIAENSSGQSYNYGMSGFPKTKPPIRAREWLSLDNPTSNMAVGRPSPLR